MTNAARKVARRAVPRIEVLPEQIYSSEYLDFYFSRNTTGYILDPANWFNHGEGRGAATFASMASGAEGDALAGYGLRPLRTMIERAGLVVEIQEDQGASRLQADYPSLEVIPTLQLQPQWIQAVLLDVEVTTQLLQATGMRLITLLVVDVAGNPVPRAKIILVYNIEKRAGVEIFTQSDGTTKLAVPASYDRIDSIAVNPLHSHWPFGMAQWKVPDAATTITLQPLGSGHQGQYHYLGTSAPTDGAGMRVAVIDGGVGPHPALNVVKGENLVLPGYEDAAHLGLYTDNGLGHGTHVAGIIAARDIGNGGPVGIAPSVLLYSYRVFAKGKRNGDDSAIAAAIDEAVDEKCDLINLSLGFPGESRPITRAVRRATAKGVVVIAAVGNAGKGVYYPAATPGVIGVTAMGRKSRLPADTVASMTYQLDPAGQDADDFVGVFCNRGPGVCRRTWRRHYFLCSQRGR